MGFQFDKIEKSPSLVDAVVDRLDKAILTGELPLGARVSEQSLAEGFGVSRGPLREALRRLEGRHLIVRVHNLGARVATFSKEDISQLLVIREALEGVAARCAAEKMTDDEIAQLAALVTIRPDGPSKRESVAEYHQSVDHDFHYRIIQGSRNSRLMDILLKDTFYLLRIYRYRFKLVDWPSRGPEAIAEHRAILEAISGRDPEAAESAMRHHLHNANANLLQNFNPLMESWENQNSGPYSDRRNGRQAGKTPS
jgi:DNA-binding GntR family transcriptional regulator